MSYSKTDDLKGLISIVGALCIIMITALKACTQVNAISEDITGVSISYVPPISLTIVTEIGVHAKVISKDIKASQYDIKSIPEVYDGDLIRVDSIVLREQSGLWQKHIYITKL